MPEFVPHQDVTTDTPKAEVTVSKQKPLPVGRHCYSLRVIDDSGNVSVVDEKDVIVADTQAPTAILSAPSVVPFGNSFVLDGSRSFDAGGGRIVKYVWTYLGSGTR